MTILLAALVYFLSHLLRAVRVQAFFVFDRPPVSRVFMVHFTTALVSFVVPFKLGEIARLYGFSKVVPNVQLGVAAFILEKFLDACVLGIALFALGNGTLRSDLVPLVAMIAFALIGFASIHAFTSGASYTARRIFVERSQSSRSLWLLRAMNNVDRIYLGIKRVAAGRMPFLMSLSCVIWAMDFLAFYVLSSREDAVNTALEFATNLGSVIGSNVVADTAWSGYSSLALYVLIAAAFFSVFIYIRFRGDPARKLPIPSAGIGSASKKRYEIEEDS